MWLTGNMPQEDLKTSKKGDYLPKMNTTMEKQPWEDSASPIKKSDFRISIVMLVFWRSTD